MAWVASLDWLFHSLHYGTSVNRLLVRVATIARFAACHDDKFVNHVTPAQKTSSERWIGVNYILKDQWIDNWQFVPQHLSPFYLPTHPPSHDNEKDYDHVTCWDIAAVVTATGRCFGKHRIHYYECSIETTRRKWLFSRKCIGQSKKTGTEKETRISRTIIQSNNIHIIIPSRSLFQ